MKLVKRKDGAIINPANGREMRQRRTPRIIFWIACGLYGWYMAHFLGRMGIRHGLGIVEIVVLVFSVIVGTIFLFIRFLNKWIKNRLVNGRLVWLFYCYSTTR
jgi:hypothetical protein